MVGVGTRGTTLRSSTLLHDVAHHTATRPHGRVAATGCWQMEMLPSVQSRSHAGLRREEELQPPALQRQEDVWVEHVRNNAGLRAARADRSTLRAGGWVVGGRPVGGGFLDQRTASSSVRKFAALADIHSRASKGRRASTSPGTQRTRRHGQTRSRQATPNGNLVDSRTQFAELLERPTFVEPSWRDTMLHQMRNPKPRRAPSFEPEQEAPEPLELAERKRAEIRKDERMAVIQHALQKGREIREQHKMKNATSFSSLEELEKYEAIARAARPKLEAQMKSIAERDPTLDPQNPIHRSNPAGARATLMAMAYDEVVQDWEADCRAVQKRMRTVLSKSVDEMAAVARGEDPDVSLFGMESPKARYVAAERARAAEGQRVAALSAMQTESAKLLDSWSRHNATSLAILETSASEFRDVTRALVDSMGETQTAGLDDLLETIERCVDEIARQRSSLVEDAKGVAESLREFLGSAKGEDNDTGEKPKSKLELRVEQLEMMLDERISMELDVIDASRDAKEAVAKEKSRQKTAEWRLEQLARQQAEVDAELSKMNKAILKEQDRKQQMTLRLGAVMTGSVQQPLPTQPKQIVEQGEDEPLRVAILRANAYYNYGVALEPEATRRVLEESGQGSAPKETKAVQEHIIHMLASGYNPLVKGFKSAHDQLQQRKQVSSSLSALRKQVEQEDREVSELARQVRERGKQLSLTTSLSVGRGGHVKEEQSPPTPGVLRRMTER